MLSEIAEAAEYSSRKRLQVLFGESVKLMFGLVRTIGILESQIPREQIKPLVQRKLALDGFVSRAANIFLLCC